MLVFVVLLPGELAIDLAHHLLVALPGLLLLLPAHTIQKFNYNF